MDKIQTWVNRFVEHSDYEGFMRSVESLKHNVCTCIDEPQTVVHYNNRPNEPVVFTAEGQASISFISYGGNSVTMFCSYDNDEWVVWDGSAKSLNDGETLYVRGYNVDGIGKSTSVYSTFSIQGNVSCEGNVMSLISTTALDIEADYCFYALFSGCTTMTSTLSLPSKTTTEGCYMSMFEGCSSMDTTPSLVAENLSRHCYDKMFKGCTSITIAPLLNSTVLEDYCYNEMFSGCTNLYAVECLAIGIEAESATTNWLSNVAQVGVFKQKAGVNWSIGTSGMPEQWVNNEYVAPNEIIYKT